MTPKHPPLTKDIHIRLDEETEKLICVFRSNWTLNPPQTGQRFHRKLVSDSTANWTVIPGQPDHFGA